MDKVLLVTGGGRGIGAATVRLAATQGWAVAVNYTTHSLAADEVVRGIRELGGTAITVKADVADEAQVLAMFQKIDAKLGRLTGLVNNAGVAGVNKPTHEITEAEWDWVQGINVKGVFFGTKHAIAHLRQAGGGSIINLSSIYGLVSAPDVPPYHASKGAVRLMTKTDALLYAADKIRVNSIHPGFIWTPMVEKHLGSAPDLDAARQAVGALHPLGHMGEPDDIAWGAVYLASDEAKFVTGTELVIDGGYTAH